ncbi:MAG TPA: NAD(P)/FAD-dependent oxidoreductase [Actinomycetota bacterium]|nr:NAD(P)/FAD-dependent oxidoreductase [Actinomycetota bacterium]
MRGGRKSPLLRAIKEHTQATLIRGERTSFDDAVARIERGAISRRRLIAFGGAAAAGAALAACSFGRSRRIDSSPPPRVTPHDARVVIVGAGLAGITAAYRLTRAGIPVRLFEARERLGGRCWTARGFAQGQTAEHGGEFIDTRHVHIRRLAAELGLPMDDLFAAPGGSRWPNAVRGQLLSDRVVNQASHRVAVAATAAARRVGLLHDRGKIRMAAISAGTATPAAVAMDALSMSAWLDREVPGVLGSPMGDWFDESMAGWYGLNMDALSAVNWLDYFVIPAPGADERWHVAGGNDRIVDAVARRLPSGTVRTGAALTAMRAQGGSYELDFDGVAGPVPADLVVLAVPFSTLRAVDLTASGLPEDRLAQIRDLVMGMDVKLLLQYDRRPATFSDWSGGMEHTDPDFETWESSVAEPGAAGLITVYAGGRTGASWQAPVPHGPAPTGLADGIVRDIDRVVPGTAAHRIGTAWADLWTLDPWTQGAYAAFAPGTYTRLWGALARPAGNVHFAGEHTSTYSQGYLNGGVESGDRVAIEIMRTLGVPVPPALARLPYSAA